ncbi:MAG: hypothetical protein IIC73_09125 [Armatimonadetes bacterium]|nr:hypothetical protein [Armatimonadota bacterium]
MREQYTEQKERLARPFDVRRTDVAAGLVVTVIGTTALTPVVLVLDANVWWVSAVAILSLAAGGFVAGLRAGQIEPLNGVLVVAVFFIAETAILMVGTATEWLPEPLPGLTQGDSTFFFVSPLGQLAAAVAGALVGGWWATRGTAASPEANEAPAGDSSDRSPGGV